MYEYLRSLYSAWSEHRSTAQCCEQHSDFIKLASRLLHYTEEEIQSALLNQTWLKNK
jgi:hypothetical protein